jgi:hypothetical protein
VKHISVVTDIAAPVATVWADLCAVSSYPEWNPFITSFEGSLVVGSRPTIRIAPPGAREMTFRPTITQMDDHEHLEWLGRLVLPGIFDGRHSFHLEALPGDRARLTQSENFSGLLVALTGTVLEQTRAGFTAMNEALRQRAETTTGAGIP